MAYDGPDRDEGDSPVRSSEMEMAIGEARDELGALLAAVDKLSERLHPVIRRDEPDKTPAGPQEHIDDSNRKMTAGLEETKLAFHYLTPRGNEINEIVQTVRRVRNDVNRLLIGVEV